MAKYNQKTTVLDELAKQGKSEFEKQADKIAVLLDPILEKTIRKNVGPLLKRSIREALAKGNKPAPEKEITLELL